MIPLWFAVMSTILVCVVAIPQYATLIPNGAAVERNGIKWPAVGHTTVSGGPRNAFGDAFQNEGYTWTVRLCEADSDGDGYSNGVELGDPQCVWSSGRTPQRTTGISHPGFADSFPAFAENEIVENSMGNATNATTEMPNMTTTEMNSTTMMTTTMPSTTMMTTTMPSTTMMTTTTMPSTTSTTAMSTTTISSTMPNSTASPTSMNTTTDTTTVITSMTSTMSPTQPPPAPIVLITATLTLTSVVDFTAFVNNMTLRDMTISALQDDLATLLDVMTMYVIINRLAVGSLIVDYSVSVPRSDPVAASNLELEAIQQRVASEVRTMSAPTLAQFDRVFAAVNASASFSTSSALVSIPNVPAQTGTTPPPTTGLTRGAIAGIVIAGVVILILIVVLVIVLRSARRDKAADSFSPTVQDFQMDQVPFV